MNERDLKHRDIPSLTAATFLKYFVLIGSSQLTAVILFYFVTRVSEGGELLTALLKKSSFTILVGLSLKSGVVTASIIAFILLALLFFAFLGLFIKIYDLSIFSAFSSASLGVMLYSPTVSKFILPDNYQMPPVPLAVSILFAVPLAALVLETLICKR
ncbi:Uncharacterised protein [Actinobaculum suis]|uniref:Uncharacterized protein n=1 Tax=Actinobaculum suis TaxID=1657 RepID=A0A1B9BEU6_9ACTO|nr:hypothetical protein [Actinobaculum suis]OCA96038.1 hypothetical protein ACU20_03225 [Actinobaculum suis]OCA96158.1 hypothetical protein ACU21_02380 [Actinobaculum suis]VDG76241.1 Uncharacterised protein [Actinobaculum suis]